MLPHPALSNTTRRTSQLVMLVLLPCMMITSLGECLSLELMGAGAYVLSAWGIVHVACNTAVALLVAWIAQPPSWMRTEFVLALISTNGLSLPLVMLEPLCRMAPLSEASFGDDGKITPYQRAVAFIFIYNLPWMCYLFGGVNYFISQKECEEKNAAASAAPSAKTERQRRQEIRMARIEGIVQDYEPSAGDVATQQEATAASQTTVEPEGCIDTVWKVALSPPMCAVYVGVLVGIVRPVNKLLYDKSDPPLLFVSSTMRVVGGAYVGVLSLLVGSSLGRTMKSLHEQSDGSAEEPSEMLTLDVDAGTNSSSGRSGVGSGAGGEVPSEPASHLGRLEIVEAALGASEQRGGRMEEKEEFTSWHFWWLLLSKMVLIPLVSVPLVMALASETIPKKMDKADADLIKLILIIECAVPSADTVIAICLQYGRDKAGSVLSQSYLFQYVIGALTLTVTVSVGHGWVYGT